eukprot:TRINITY_DN24802_c0_g1_i1.p1 TRINITY_DN24802_c0_g1~~TRINITY_DN24802_c0_g1_i1.p1  ORF type:complete len:475 (+),score=86.67 TRINITY_DN24802_c0_g1_i1:581-2005(+)
MPALKIFGRLLPVGSDDFVIPGAFGLCLRLAWLGLIITVVVVNFDIFHECGVMVSIFLIGCLVIFFLSSLIELMIMLLSMRGRIIDPRPRSGVVVLLYGHAISIIIELAWTSMGSYLLFFNSSYCSELVGDRPFFTLTKIVVVSCWVHVGLIIVTIFCIFNPYLSNPSNDSQLDLHWVDRLSLLFCCAGVGDQDQSVFKSVSQLIAKLTVGYDLVPTDVFAGLRILHNKKQYKYDIIGRHVEQHVLGDLCYWMKYAIAIYGWPLLIYSNGPCVMFPDGHTCYHPSYVDEDNCCGTNAAAMKLTLGEESEVVYGNFDNPVFHTPYLIAIDHVKRCVVISLRGTLSLADVLVDASCQDQNIPYPDLEEETTFTHWGMWKSANSVKQDIDKKGVLKRIMQNEIYRHHGLIIVGHSLGAGTATLLSFLLKAEYENLRCIAYSPPGALLSLPAARHCSAFVTSVIVGDDWVGRLGRASM